MDIYQITLLIILCVFYIAYFSKVISQRKGGIVTNQMGKGSKPAHTLRIEKLLSIATFAVVPVEVASIYLNTRASSSLLTVIGIILAAIGVALFILAMLTLRDSWRAGIPTNDETKFIQTGIYGLSRNPAFLGFDLMYIGTLIAYPNLIHLPFCAFAITMLHLQILEEEKYLAQTFGQPYLQYKKSVARYFLIF